VPSLASPVQLAIMHTHACDCSKCYSRLLYISALYHAPLYKKNSNFETSQHVYQIQVAIRFPAIIIHKLQSTSTSHISVSLCSHDL
jgi:hypothetical protein